MTEWLYDGEVIVQSEGGAAYLEIPAVNDTIHGREYRCRITTPYSVEERNVTITTTCMLNCYARAQYNGHILLSF